jgi:hypothetical protein
MRSLSLTLVMWRLCGAVVNVASLRRAVPSERYVGGVIDVVVVGSAPPDGATRRVAEPGSARRDRSRVAVWWGASFSGCVDRRDG